MVSYYQDSSGVVTIGYAGTPTTSSGRPKAIMMQEDDNWIYTQGHAGSVTKRPKSKVEQYIWWWKTSVQFSGEERITPLTDFEKDLGITLYRTSFDYRGQVYTQEDFERLFRDNPDSGFCNDRGQCDWSNVHENSYKDIPTAKEDGEIQHGKMQWGNYFKRKATEQNLITVSVSRLEFREKQKPAVVEKIPTPARPNPKEVEPIEVEPIEVEPIKEAVKYSPLMIAGILVVVVILLLKRRRA